MLTVLRSPRKLRRFVTYDLEWVPGTYQVRVVGCYDGERYRHYRSVDAFLAAEMTDKNRGTWFYAHAGGLADVQFVFEAIMARHREYKIDASFSGSSAIICHVSKKPHGKNTWHFLDSFWLFRDSLAAIGHSIGLEKTGPKALEGATEAEIKEWYATAPMAELLPYNENDCVILWEAIARFQRQILELGGQLQMTIASTAMHLFRRRFLTRDVGTADLVNDIGRKSYYASRVEVLQNECESANYYDLNSSFPFAMTEPVPGELIKTGRRLPDKAGALYMADVEFSIPESFLPPIPTRIDGRLFFPFGAWRSWLTGIDIELLQREGGKIIKVHDCLTFAPMNDLKDYAMTIYNLRRATEDPFERILYKYLLNSLYGKFGEKRAKEKLFVHPNAAVLERWANTYSSEELDTMRLMPGAYVEPTLVGIAHEHVPIASYITARARQTLYDCLTMSRDDYYCDTDGFATTDTFPTSDELGGLKLEKRIDHGNFLAPKVYRLDGDVQDKKAVSGWRKDTIVKAKGFSLGKGKAAVSRFERLMEGHEIEIERMARIRENLSKGVLIPHDHKFDKRFRHELTTKRFHYPDGFTRPWSIDELKDGLT